MTEISNPKQCRNLDEKGYSMNQKVKIVSINTGRRLLELRRSGRKIDVVFAQVFDDNGKLKYTLKFLEPIPKREAQRQESLFTPYMCDEPDPNDPLLN